MIHENATSVLTLMGMIYSSPIVFHLTGSRFFETEKEDSDWDFFVDRTEPGLKDFLQANGFRRDGESYERDLFMTEIWAKDNVHIQIVVSAKLKEQLQKRIKELRLQTSDKDVMRRIWQLAIRLYKDGSYCKNYGVVIP